MNPAARHRRQDEATAGHVAIEAIRGFRGIVRQREQTMHTVIIFGSVCVGAVAILLVAGHVAVELAPLVKAVITLRLTHPMG